MDSPFPEGGIEIEGIFSDLAELIYSYLKFKFWTHSENILASKIARFQDQPLQVKFGKRLLSLKPFKREKSIDAMPVEKNYIQIWLQ